MKFSQRIGKKPIKTDFQIESMDNDLRIALWNAFHFFFTKKVDSKWISRSSFDLFFQIMWHNFFKLPLDNLDDHYETTYKRIREYFFKFEWFEVYDFIEFVTSIDCPVNQDEFRKFCNLMMERELSGYRFVDDKITKITAETELNEIEEAIDKSQKTNLAGVNAHLKTALIKLSDRKYRDYRNSIKEAISAVEALAQLISGNSKAELCKALAIIEKKVDLHGSLKKGFSAIYGYTCDEGGIRHAMLEEDKIDFEDAKYMLVSCAAFINYLTVKASKAGVKL